MSAGVEDSSAVAHDPAGGAAGSAATVGEADKVEDVDGADTAGAKPGGGDRPGRPGKHHHVLIEADEDRWAWRRRIRQNPHQLRIYRVGVAIAGLLLICLGIITGPLPGPGGIPLVLLGLATWSSEFEWAYRLRVRLKAEIKKYGGWPTGKKVAFWVAFSAVCASLGYAYLLTLGIPFWVPEVGASLLDHLPGVHAR